jgi:hypothetical protein
MAGYRLYFLLDGRIRHAVPLDCDNDAEAIRTVLDHTDGRAMELWCGARIVKCFEAAPHDREGLSQTHPSHDSKSGG